MKQIDCEILENKKISRDFYRMRIGSSYLAANMTPGQFIEVRPTDSFDPLLRRPFSAHRILRKSVELLYEVVGKSTEALSSKKAGELLDIIGPLGNGFKLDKKTSSAILIAGGIGVAPLLALAENLAKNKIETSVIIGARTKTHILCEKEFKSLRCSVKIATEDGSKGQRGLATDLLRDRSRAGLNLPYGSVETKSERAIYACGPVGMLKAVAMIAKDKGALYQVSLEERMACGVGVCLGCPVKTVSGYKMVCKDGPVFNAEEIKW